MLVTNDIFKGAHHQQTMAGGSFGGGAFKIHLPHNSKSSISYRSVRLDILLRWSLGWNWLVEGYGRSCGQYSMRRCWTDSMKGHNLLPMTVADHSHNQARFPFFLLPRKRLLFRSTKSPTIQHQFSHWFTTSGPVFIIPSFPWSSLCWTAHLCNPLSLIWHIFLYKFWGGGKQGGWLTRGESAHKDVMWPVDPT